MIIKFRQEGIIEISPEGETEVFALHHFIKTFERGYSQIKINRTSVGDDCVIISMKNHSTIINKC